MRSAGFRPVRVRQGRRALFCGLCAALLLALGVAVGRGALDGVDASVSQALGPLRSPATIAVFLAITSMGSDGALTGMMLVATALLAGLSRPARTAPLWLTFLGTEASTYAIKYLLDRSRPAVLPGVGHALTPSFPSAHSAGTAAVVGIIAALLAIEQPPGTRRLSIWLGAGLIAGLIGFSRVLLNLHYLSDVLGGFLVAGFWLTIGAGLLARRPA